MLAGRLERRPKRIHHELQLAGVDPFIGQVMPDVDDADISKFARKERPDPRAQFWFEDVERVVRPPPRSAFAR